MMLGYQASYSKTSCNFFSFFGFSFFQSDRPTDRPNIRKRIRHQTEKRDGLAGNGTMLPALSGLLSCVTSSQDEIYLRALSLSKDPEKSIIVMIVTPTFAFYYI